MPRGKDFTKPGGRSSNTRKSQESPDRPFASGRSSSSAGPSINTTPHVARQAYRQRSPLRTAPAQLPVLSSRSGPSHAAGPSTSQAQTPAVPFTYGSPTFASSFASPLSRRSASPMMPNTGPAYVTLWTVDAATRQIRPFSSGASSNDRAWLVVSSQPSGSADTGTVVYELVQRGWRGRSDRPKSQAPKWEKVGVADKAQAARALSELRCARSVCFCESDVALPQYDVGTIYHKQLAHFVKQPVSAAPMPSVPDPASDETFFISILPSEHKRVRSADSLAQSQAPGTTLTLFLMTMPIADVYSKPKTKAAKVIALHPVLNASTGQVAWRKGEILPYETAVKRKGKSKWHECEYCEGRSVREGFPRWRAWFFPAGEEAGTVSAAGKGKQPRK